MKADVLPAAARYPWDGGPHGLDPDTDTDTRVRGAGGGETGETLVAAMIGAWGAATIISALIIALVTVGVAGFNSLKGDMRNLKSDIAISGIWEPYWGSRSRCSS